MSGRPHRIASSAGAPASGGSAFGEVRPVDSPSVDDPPIEGLVGRSDLGLGPDVRAVLFDLDGVLTDTAEVHEAAWKDLFDEVVPELAPSGPDLLPFSHADYLRYVDGKPRAAGVRDFLASRSVVLPEGDPADGPGERTVHGLGRRKNEALLERIRRDGLERFDGSVRYLRAARARGCRCGVVSSSANARLMLDAAELSPLVDVVVDGVVAAELGLPGKPAPDTFVLAAERAGFPTSQTAVVEDAIAGVEAAARGGFAVVIGVDRAGHADALRAAGADLVVDDLAALVA